MTMSEVPCQFENVCELLDDNASIFSHFHGMIPEHKQSPWFFYSKLFILDTLFC